MTEDDLMRGNGENSSKSDVMDKNLHQMFDVLRVRLETIKGAAATRMKLCEEDVNKHSDRTSDQAPKIIDEFDEVVPRSMRDVKMPTLTHKDNLISSDSHYIDPVHLVFSRHTKMATESAKKIEFALEESFGNYSGLKEMKNKKKAGQLQLEKSKKSEQLKHETSKINRQKIEKKLSQNMESFVTRSVMDPEMKFTVPTAAYSECEWPVTVKWSLRDPRSKIVENTEAEFDPDLLLRYAIERISLPSGRKLFSFLVRLPVIQRYFIALFWIIKVKFFDHDDDIETIEAYLMRMLSADYRVIIELLAARAHAEHEKDFVFKFLPYVLTNAVYYGLYYIFPGSRHIYTKALKKTIYMQIIQIMHGIQVCPIAVKVAWGKFFPEDLHEEDEDDNIGGGGGEMVPVTMAVKGSVKLKTGLMKLEVDSQDSESVNSSSINSDKKSPPRSSYSKLKFKSSSMSATNLTAIVKSSEELIRKASSKQFHQLSKPLPIGRVQGGFLSDMPPQFTSSTAANADDRPRSRMKSGVSRPGSRPDNSQGGVDLVWREPTPKSISFGFTSFSNDGYGSHAVTNPNSRGSNRPSSPNDIEDSTADDIRLQMTVEGLLEVPAIKQSVHLTHLKPPIARPGGAHEKRFVIRQNVHEGLDAHEQSPQMKLYLAETKANKPPTPHIQPLQRTIPISWCAAGGSDTHHKRVLSTELHNEISAKLRENEKLFQQYRIGYHSEKLKTIRDNAKALEKILSSGQTNISKLSLDIIRHQRAKSGATGKELLAPAEIPTSISDSSESQQQLFPYYSEEELNRILDEI